MGVFLIQKARKKNPIISLYRFSYLCLFKRTALKSSFKISLRNVPIVLQYFFWMHWIPSVQWNVWPELLQSALYPDLPWFSNSYFSAPTASFFHQDVSPQFFNWGGLLVPKNHEIWFFKYLNWVSDRTKLAKMVSEFWIFQSFPELPVFYFIMTFLLNNIILFFLVLECW